MELQAILKCTVIAKIEVSQLQTHLEDAHYSVPIVIYSCIGYTATLTLLASFKHI